MQRVQVLRDAFCTSIFGDFDQVEDLVYTFDESGSNLPITEDQLEELEAQEMGFDDQLVTRSRLQAAGYVSGNTGKRKRDEYRTVISFDIIWWW